MLPKDEYLKTVRRPYPPLFCTLINRGYSNPTYFEGILTTPFSVTNMAHVDNVWYYGKAEMEKGGQLALESWRDPAVFEFAQKEFARRADALGASAQESFESFCRAYEEYMPALILVFAVEKPTETALRSALSRTLSPQEIEETMSTLNIPLEDNIYKQEEYDLVMTSDIQAHIANYRWLLARYGEEREYTAQEAEAKLREIDKEEFLRHRDAEKQKLRQVITHTKELLGDDAYLVDIFQYMIYYRTHRTDIMNKSAYLAIPILKAKAASLGLSYEQLLRCSVQEVLEGALPSSEILAERMKDCSTVLEGRQVRCVTGDESQRIIASFQEDALHTTELRGTTACKGVVRGTVKRIFGKDDFGRIENGDILVTSMTTPEMVPIMKVSAAFVTDEGGVTCHAAIISREMKKPCIIGTKVATQVLKDGDMVEVDADNGIVKILQHAVSGSYVFEKIYTRDTTYIMQELWAYGCSEGIEKTFGWKNPHLPGIIHYMNEGSIEIWENLTATKWLQDAVLEKNTQDSTFIDGILTTYKEKLEEIHTIWKKETLSISELKELITLSREALFYFIAYYYSAVDERTPKKIRDKALKMRNTDEFFADNDAVIRNTIVNSYPELKGYETTIFIDELESPPAMDVVQARKQHSLIIQGKDLFVGFLDDFAASHPAFVFTRENIVASDMTEFKGYIAQKGVVRGTVRLVRRRDQIDAVQEGDIIVSPMTTPDFLPAMQKAAAFVTDEGGITCHAAIVSREMRKPCIIGTKVATQVLKDGDVVEVDADTGVVRIINKA